MVLPQRLARINKRLTNRVLRHLVGIGPLAELEHVGRRSGRTHRTTLLAFRDGDVVTLALTYGSDVDWLKNLRAAGRGRLRVGRTLLDLSAPSDLPTAVGMARMPGLARMILPRVGVEEFVELPVIGTHRRR
ncbi:nitroreductase family deazaflavin-dependent oxidoreductase [Pseudactinotalea suaedae]|jgi:deazaflavin-dependent oxidoreductase (nitroreductase family)|uniref:nitroreductase family deazaflavin-dependent oxidoreductase n=1 Tax=Pseudactinotalea suaedae TaxID=1524924 RepID=UPI0012E25668|nr:nitroreductase family deazaflavin-dependent oxidoreductase [Pseudactinotalea suaedae]